MKTNKTKKGLLKSLFLYLYFTMQSIYILLFSSFMLVNCSAQTKDSISIEYKAVTRGSQISLLANSEGIIYKSYDKNLELKISEHQWDEITVLVLNIDLDKIKNLIPPSTESHLDRAMIGSLLINKNGKIYESSTFDHGNPPSEIKKLIDILFELVD